MRDLQATLNGRLTAITARSVTQHLGQLAEYLMNHDALIKSGMHRPKASPLPRSVGCCSPIFGVRNTEWHKFLKPAFVLPLQWQLGTPHDQRLPPAIRLCADAVVSEFCGKDGQSYSIHYVDKDLSWPDLRQLDSGLLGARSCFATLAAGLSSLRQRVPPDTTVWASADWDGQFKAVDMIEQKLALAASHQARLFYVAAGQSEIVELQRDFPSVQVKQLGEPSGNRSRAE